MGDQRTAHPSSFRDPAGHIFTKKGTVYRQVNASGKVDFDLLISSGLYEHLVADRLLVTHVEVSSPKPAGKNGYKVIRPEHIPFISYPFEWSFSQLKDAALLTLEIQKRALAHGMMLKDASAYNIQFIGKKPIFIDTLSFCAYVEGDAWEGYRQFCEHFLAPLALASYTSLDALKLLRSNLEGIPLDLAAALLPKRTKLRAGLLSHIFVHGGAQRRYQNAASDTPTSPAQARRVSRFALEGLVSSLERTIRGLKLPKQQTEWGEYYTFTNYTEQGFAEKRALVESFLESVKPLPKTVWDMGANNGEFSSLAANRGMYTIAFDIDPLAVERNYLTKSDSTQTRHMLPLVQDIVNPSPATGFLGTERDSLMERGPADVVMALALIHHLAIGRNLPLERVAELFSRLGEHIIVEFVPKQDSKVQILLASRRDVFPEYDAQHFEEAMATHFNLVKKTAIKDTRRTLYLYKRK